MARTSPPAPDRPPAASVALAERRARLADLARRVAESLKTHHQARVRLSAAFLLAVAVACAPPPPEPPEATRPTPTPSTGVAPRAGGWVGPVFSPSGPSGGYTYRDGPQPGDYRAPPATGVGTPADGRRDGAAATRGTGVSGQAGGTGTGTAATGRGGAIGGQAGGTGAGAAATGRGQAASGQAGGTGTGGAVTGRAGTSGGGTGGVSAPAAGGFSSGRGGASASSGAGG